MSTPATGLTTPELVNAYAGIDGATHKELIEDLIRQVTDEIETGIGARIVKADYEDVLDGSALGALVLLHIPVITFRTLSLNGTEVDADTYQVDTEAGTVQLVTSGAVTSFTSGTRNYTAVYTAGYETIPAGLEGIATDIVARRVSASVQKRVGEESQSLGTGGSTVFESREISEAEWKKLRVYGVRF